MSKSKKDKKEEKLTYYQKTVLLERLISTKSNPNNVTEVAKTPVLKLTKNQAISIVNEIAKSTQDNLPELNDNQTFKSMNDWANIITQQNGKNICNHELPLVAKICAENCVKPISTTDEIDFPKLYNTLYNMMMGYPVPDLEGKTKELLMESYSELMEEIESSDMDENVNQLEKVVLTSNFKSGKLTNGSGSSKHTTDNFLNDNGLNLFDMPSSMLFDPPK